MVRIAGTGTALPPHRLDAAAFRDALSVAFAPHFADLRPLLRMADRCGVRDRYLALPVAETLTPSPLGQRNTTYMRCARELGAAAARGALTAAHTTAAEIDLVVTTSCTGYMLPSLDACLVAELGLRADVRRLPITELGCLAGAAALSRAGELLRGLGGGSALVVAAEFPSLTFQLGDGSLDNLVSTLVFADGAGAAVLRSDEGEGFRLRDARSQLVPDSLGAMGFNLSEDGFHVVLSKDVPALLARPFADGTRALLQANGLTVRDLEFACIHPGGPKILRAVDEALGVEGLTAPSWQVLERFGNQSSVAVFSILDLLMRRPPPDGSLGLLAGFGPGLSLELALLERRG